MRGLDESTKILDTWYQAIGDVPPAPEVDSIFSAALSDDLNTPAAIARLHQMARPPEVGTTFEAGVSMLGDRTGEDAKRYLKSSAMLIGLLGDTASSRKGKEISISGIDQSAVAGLIEARNAARKAKDFKESDRIRDELAAMGVVLKDSKDGTTWEIAR